MSKIAVIIGHDKTSPGAFSPYLHASEYVYNSEVASYLHKFDVYKRPEGGGYKTQMMKLAELVRPKNYDLIVELHFNSFNKKVSGCETVSYPGNNHTEALGKEFCRLITNHYCTINRGAKIGVEKDANGNAGRGWWFLHLMPANAIIVEPFFGDTEEALKFENEAVYAQIIKDWLS